MAVEVNSPNGKQGQLRSFKSFEGSKRVLSQLSSVKTYDEDKRACAPRPTTKARGYGRSWNSYRRWYLRQHPLCVRCGGLAALVDHIHPIRYGGAPRDPKNHQPLCQGCHATKSRAEEAEAKANGWIPKWGVRGSNLQPKAIGNRPVPLHTKTNEF